MIKNKSCGYTQSETGYPLGNWRQTDIYIMRLKLKMERSNFGWAIRLTLSICFFLNFDGFWRWITDPSQTDNPSLVWKRPVDTWRDFKTNTLQEYRFDDKSCNLVNENVFFFRFDSLLGSSRLRLSRSVLRRAHSPIKPTFSISTITVMAGRCWSKFIHIKPATVTGRVHLYWVSQKFVPLLLIVSLYFRTTGLGKEIISTKVVFQYNSLFSYLLCHLLTRIFDLCTSAPKVRMR